MKARAEEEVSKTGPDGPGDQAGPGGLTRHRVRRAAAPARPRPPRPRDPLPQHARGPRRSSASRATSTPPRSAPSTPPTGSSARSSTGSSCVDEAQVHSLPVRPGRDRTQLARVLGYRDEGSSTALDQFEAAHRRQQAQVRSIHEKLFFRPLLEAIAGTGPLSQEAAEERLAAFGFVDVAHTRAALAELTTGLSRRSQLMGQLFPLLLEWLSETPDPDLGPPPAPAPGRGPGPVRRAGRGLPGGARGGRAGLPAAGLAAGWWATPCAAIRSSSRPWPTTSSSPVRRAGRSWSRRRSERWPGGRTPRSARRGCGASSAGSCCGSPPATCSASPRWRRSAGELANLADACVEATLRDLAPVGALRRHRRGPARAAGSCPTPPTSTSSSSTTGRAPPTSTWPRRRPPGIISGIGATTAEGQTFRIDANLRPEGKQGPLARSLDGYRHLLRQRGRSPGSSSRSSRPGRWPATSSWPSGSARWSSPTSTAIPFPEESIREVRRMKARVERERIPPGRGPAVPPEAGPGLTVGRGVDGAAPPADPRRRRPGLADDLDRGRAARAGRPRAPRPPRRRRAGGRLPVLRAGPEPAGTC